MTNPLNKYRGQIVQSLIENNDQEMSLKPLQAQQQAQPVQPTQDVGIVPFDVPQAQKLPTTPVQPIQPQPVAPVTAVQPLDYDFTQGMNTPLPTQPVQQPTVAKTAPIQPVQQQQFTPPGDYTQKNIGQTNYITQDEASYILERGLNTVGQWINLVPQIGGLIGLASTDTKRKTASLNMLADQLERSGRSREEVLKIRQEARKATKVGAGLDKFWSDVITYEIVADSSAAIEKKYEGKVDAGTKVLADVSSAALDMLPQTAIAYFSGGTYAMAYVFASSAARSTKEGLQMGATPEEAQTYGILNGAIEVGTEIISGGWAGVPKGKFTGLARQGLLGGLEEITLKMAKSDLGKKAISMAYQYLGEGAEEYLAEVLGNWAKGVIDPNMVKPWDEVQKDAAYAGLVGALTSVVMDVGRVGAVKIAERSALKQMEEFNSMSFEEQVGYATAMLAKTDTDLVFADEFAGQEVKGAGMMVTQDGKNTVVLPTRLQDGSENILTLSLVHEFTHTLEQKGIYNEFKSFVLKDLKRIGLLDALRQQKQALYENQGVQLSAEEIDQEIVATFVQDNLFKRVVMVDGKPQTFTDALAFRRFLKQMPKRQFNLFKNIAKGFLDSHYAGELNESIDQLNKEYNAAIKANDLELAEQIGAELSDLLQASNLVNPTYTKALELAFDQLVKDVEPAQQKRLAETTFKQDVIDKATPISQVNPKTTKYQLTDAEGDTLDVNPAVLKDVVASAKAIGLEEKELVAIHNLETYRLKDILDLGGFPMPSIAVTTDKLGHEGFGEVSVVFKPDVLEGSPTFWRDAYTPRFPKIYFGFTEHNDYVKFRSQIIDYGKKALNKKAIGMLEYDELERIVGQLTYNMSSFDIYNWDYNFRKLANSNIGKMAIASTKGLIDWENMTALDIQKAVDGISKSSQGDVLANFKMYAGTFGASSYVDLNVDKWTKNGLERKPISQLVKPLTAENVVEAMLTDEIIGSESSLTGLNFSSLSPYVVSVMKSKEEIKRQKSLLNRMDQDQYFALIRGINNALDAMVANVADAAYYAKNGVYADDVNGSGRLSALSDRGIIRSQFSEKMRDYFSKYGAKSTVSNFNSFMKKAGYDIEKYNVTSDMAKDLIIPLYLKMKNPNISEISVKYNGGNIYFDENAFTANVQYFGQQPDQFGIYQYDTIDIDPGWKDFGLSKAMVSIIDNIKSITSTMFESKPQRVVGFDEIDTVLLPKGLDDPNSSLIKKLNDNNINHQFYDLQDGRLEIVKSLSSAKFMLLPDEQTQPRVSVDIEQVKSLPEMKKAIKSFPTYIEPTPTGFTLSATRMEPENATESIRGGTYYRLTDISKLPADQVKDGSRSLAKKISVSNPLVNFQRAGGATFGLAGNVTVRNKAIIEKLFGQDGYADLKGVFDGILNSIENKNYTDQSLEDAYRKVLSRYGTFNETQIENIIDQTMKQDVKGFGTSFVKDKDTKAAWNTMSILDAIIFDKAKVDGYDSIMLFGMYNDRRVPEEIRNEIAKTTDEKQLEKLNKELSKSEKGWFRPDELIILSNAQQTPIPNVGLFKTQFMLEDGKKRNFRRFPVAEKVDLVDWKRRYIAGANVILDYAKQTNTDTSKADVAFLVEALATKKIDPRTYFRIFNKFNQGNYIEYGSLYNIGQAADPWGSIAPFNAVYKRLEKQGKIKLNDAELDKWLDLIKGKQNRRTKAEWLKIAENDAANTEFKDEQDFMNHAIGTWKALAPNQKAQLNRQGEKYVEFKLQDWIQAMLDTKPDAVKLVKRDPKKKAININDIKDTEDAQVDAQDVVDEEPLPGEESRAMALEMAEQRQSTDELLRQEYGDVDEDAFEAQQARQEQEYIDYIQSLTDEQYQRFVADLDNETDAEYADTIRSQMATEQPTQTPIEPTTEEMMDDEEILADGKTETEIREFLADQGFTDEAIETEIEQLKLERDQEMATEEPTTPPAKEPVQVEQPKVEPIPDDAKIAQRKHPVTAANSGVLDEAQVNIVQRDLEQGKFDYVVMADKPAIERANKSIGNDLDAAFNEIKVLFDSGRRFKKDDMVKAEVLIQAYAAAKQTKKAMELLAMVAEIGTELGQSVQAMSVIKKMGAAGRLMAMDRVLKRLSKQYDNLELKISDELRNELLSKTDTKEMEDVVDKIKGEIAKQLPANFMDKLNAWRYLSMLGNPKTHIRNYLGNAIFWGVNKAKDSVGAALESVFVEQGKRTKALVIDKKIKAYARDVFEQRQDEITSSGKYDINRDIESKKAIFKNKALEKVRQFNFDWLEKEDVIYMRAGFVQALGQYMTAQGLTPETLTGKALEQAILVATEQAKKRTFRQASNLANTLNALEKDSKIGRFIIGSTVPFKKTPINILKAGYEFSPLGLFVNGISGINDVKNEKITPTEYIDRISAGLTGTGIALLGAWLYSMGLLTAGEDDEEGKRKTALERSLGFQRYSLRLGDWSVSLDWVAPAVMPLMIGAEMAAELNRKYDESILNIAPKALANIFNPAFELTMLQGVVEAMNTFEDGGASAIGDMFSTMASNYVTQFFPTVGGQMARTIDPTQRTTYSGSDFEGFLETTGRKILNKIPGGTYLNEPVVNIKGEEVKQPGDVWLRGIQQFLNPANIKENITDDTDREILRLFNQTGETSVIPPTAPSTFTYNGETIELGDGKTEYAKTLGSVSYNLLSEVFNHKDYDDLTDDIKAKVAADAYEYAVNGAKAQLLGKKGITFVNSTYTKILEAENAGIKVSDYLIMKNRFDTIKATGDFSRKENILAELVYGGYTDDEIYNYLVYVAGYSYLSSDQKYIDILRGVR